MVGPPAWIWNETGGGRSASVRNRGRRVDCSLGLWGAANRYEMKQSNGEGVPGSSRRRLFYQWVYRHVVRMRHGGLKKPTSGHGASRLGAAREQTVTAGRRPTHCSPPP